MALKISVRFLTGNNDYEISADPSLTVFQFKELLRQQILFFQRFSSIPTEVLKLSLEGFDGGGELTGNVMEDGRPLSAYPLREERPPVLLALERPVEKIVCPACQQPFVQWSSDRLCCGDAKEEMEGQEGELEKRKARIPMLLNCGHSVCLECWREGLLAAEEKEVVSTNATTPLAMNAAEDQNRVEKDRRTRELEKEKEKAENAWKFECREKSCGRVTYCQIDQERSCHGGMQRLVHLKKREWVEAEEVRGRCRVKTCGAEAMFFCPDCDVKHCITHYVRAHQYEDMSDHVPRVLLSHKALLSDIFKSRFCCYCYCGGGSSSCMKSQQPHCDHRDADMTSAREMTRANVMEQLKSLENLQTSCWKYLAAWNGVMEQLQEHRVNGMERIRKEFDDVISRLDPRIRDVMNELRGWYREKECEIMQKMEALGNLSGEIEAGLLLHRKVLDQAAATCIVRDVVDISAVQSLASKLGSEASWDSLNESAEISTKFNYNNLALRYKNGIGVEKDEVVAVRLYRLSAEQGNADAQFNLGVCFEKGIGVQKDVDEAVRLYRFSAEQGNADGQKSLGVLLNRLSAEQGNADGQNSLGVCYEKGIGVEKDVVEAVRLYRLSAEQGNEDGQYNLGVCYEKGIGVQKDVVEAVRLYQQLAKQGHKIFANIALRRLCPSLRF